VSVIFRKTWIDELAIAPYDQKPHTPSKSILQAKGNHMPEVIVRKGEPIDRALKRLKSKLDAEGIMDEVRRLRAFETPTQKSRRKAKANAKRAKAKFRFNPA
jgi:small subunit ribosomal protein S21